MAAKNRKSHFRKGLPEQGGPSGFRGDVDGVRDISQRRRRQDAAMSLSRLAPAARRRLPQELYRKAVPAWLGMSMEDLADELGEVEAVEYAKGSAAGFESGLIMAVHRPEWARGFYTKLRDYYLLTHTVDDLADWDVHSERTCQVMPVEIIHMKGYGTDGIT